MFGWGTLNRISYSSIIWIWVSIFIGNYWTSLYMNAVFWTNPRIRDRTALTTLVFRIWHAFIVVLIRILLDIVQINWIPVGLSSCRSWTLHYHILLMITILRSIWWNCVAYSHSGIVLVKNLLLSDNNLIWRRLCIALFLQNLLLFRSVIGWMERMNRSSTLSWKLWPHLRRAKAIILAILLLSKVLFNLQSLSFRHISLSTTQSISWLNSWTSFRGFYATIDRWSSWSILRAFHFHFG